ncbi:hypothetical protein KBK19_11070 [Microvirga sp. STR05]|uniref:YcxB family protein n=1 Tax=Hymenobacter duratus TaxID=2771356 RepID=A0ABR8JIY6_9BACT|nr:hypothetical protein [Hymenobacter duratus]MBD2715578.1 hypothetical protein [Hymenobacter duratus]MBR7950486.1 hypothetical protein [Microvirga sp. STR05]
MTSADFVAVNFRLWRQQRRTRFNHWLLGLALLLLAVSVAVDVVQNGRITNQGTLAMLAVGLLYGLLRMVLVRYQLRRGFAKNPANQQPIDFAFDTDRLRGSSSAGTFAVRWNQLQRAIRVGDDWLLLYPNDAACYYLDLRRLQAPATPAELLALLREQQVPVVEL